MNGKKAKSLRRKAIQMTEGFVTTKYTVGVPPIYNPIFDNNMIVGYKKIHNGKPIKMEYCTRKIYQSLKK